MPPPTFLALGDSYTIGEGVTASDSWPVQLTRSLHAAAVDVAEPRIIARTGWTCAELLAAVRESGVSGRHDLVSLMVGVNDQYREYGLDRFRPDFDLMLATA